MKPILFNTDMVCAILAGHKTVTRRVIRPQPVANLAYVCAGYRPGMWGYPDRFAWKYWADETYKMPDGMPHEERYRRWTPPYSAGDILYVRETWAVWSRTEGTAPEIHYKADGEELSGVKWHPSIHMPCEAARIFLWVTDVRVERLQGMAIDDFKAEGICPKRPKDLLGTSCDCSWESDGCLEAPCPNRDAYLYLCYAEPFKRMWNSTIKPADRALYGWEANPWVWVIIFERISKEAAYA